MCVSHSVCSGIFDLTLSKVRLLVLIVNPLTAIASISKVNLQNGQTTSNTLAATCGRIEVDSSGYVGMFHGAFNNILNALGSKGDEMLAVHPVKPYCLPSLLYRSVFLAHAKALENSTAKYPIKRVVCTAFAIPQNYLDANYEKVFSGQLPKRIVVGLVDNRAFNGDRTRNPFNFQHFDLAEISLYLDGQQQHALKPIQPSFGNGLYVRAYNMLFAGTSKLNHDEGKHISREDFVEGYALYAYDLTADLAEDDHFNLVKHGNVRLALKFSAALEQTDSQRHRVCRVRQRYRDRNLLLDFGV